MPSQSLLNWEGARSEELDEFEAAHQALGGTGRGRRYATQQVNQAYTVLLSSQFQAFCRDLHSESVDHLVAILAPVSMVLTIRILLTRDLKLNRGNPNPGNLGADFNRLGVDFWDRILERNARNAARQKTLLELTDWRNRIAHQDFTSLPGGSSGRLHLSAVRNWRRVCNCLARDFDGVMQDYLRLKIGKNPW